MKSFYVSRDTFTYRKSFTLQDTNQMTLNHHIVIKDAIGQFSFIIGDNRHLPLMTGPDEAR